MSNIFLKNELSGIFDSVTESDVSLPQWISIIDQANNTSIKQTISREPPTQPITQPPKQQGGSLFTVNDPQKMNYTNGSETSSYMGSYGGNMSTTSDDVSATSSFMGSIKGDLSATSVDESATSSMVGNYNTANLSATSSFVGQLGGNYNVSKKSNDDNDINKLVSMLTSESSSNNFMGLSETSSATLEKQLINILNQDGGAKKSKKSKKSYQKGGNNIGMSDIKGFFMKLKNDGVDVKLNNKTMSEFFNLNTTTNVDTPNTESATSSALINEMLGGAKKSKKSSKKASKKSSKKASKSNMDGGVNPGFEAFLKFKKHFAEKLQISNGPLASKAAGAAQREAKEKHP